MKLLFDEANKRLNKDLEGELNFKVFTLNLELQMENCINFSSHQNLDNKKLINYSSCPKKYSAISVVDNIGFSQLSKDIHEAALECGFAIIRNGNNRKIRGNKLCAGFNCKRCQSYRGNSFVSIIRI